MKKTTQVSFYHDSAVTVTLQLIRNALDPLPSPAPAPVIFVAYPGMRKILRRRRFRTILEDRRVLEYGEGWGWGWPTVTAAAAAAADHMPAGVGGEGATEKKNAFWGS